MGGSHATSACLFVCASAPPPPWPDVRPGVEAPMLRGTSGRVRLCAGPASARLARGKPKNEKVFGTAFDDNRYNLHSATRRSWFWGSQGARGSLERRPRGCPPAGGERSCTGRATWRGWPTIPTTCPRSTSETSSATSTAPPPQLALVLSSLPLSSPPPLATQRCFLGGRVGGQLSLGQPEEVNRGIARERQMTHLYRHPSGDEEVGQWRIIRCAGRRIIGCSTHTHAQSCAHTVVTTSGH